MKMVKRIFSVSLVAVCLSLGLVACGGPTFDGIKMTKNEKDRAPEITFQAPYQFKNTEETINKFSEGNGADIKEGSYQRLLSNQYDPKTGEKLNDAELSETFGLTEQYKSLNGSHRYELLAEAFKSAKVGATFAFLSPSSEQSGGAIVAFRLQDSTEDEEVVKRWSQEDAERVQELKNQQADKIKVFSEEEVRKMKSDKALPTVEFKDGKPQVRIPEGVTAPDGLVVDVVDEGDGEVVKESDVIKANYVLYRWQDPQKVVQSSYDSGNPIDISLGTQAIAGWRKGLAGQKVGSKVLLTVPPALAYGTETEAKANNMPDGTLVFIVEILGINPPEAG